MNNLEGETLRPIEKLYHNFCERMANLCETEAKTYVEHPNLHDGDCQFISSLQAKHNEWREQLQRMEAAHPRENA